MKTVLICAAVVSAAIPNAWAGPVPPFATDQSSQYLIVARMSINGNVDVVTSNFELGANKAPVPSTGSFLDDGGSGGPSLLGAVPDLPANAAAVFQGIGGHGNIALTDPDGSFKLQNVGVYADPGIGIRVTGTDFSLNESSNAFFNDYVTFYPNTFDEGTQTGFSVDPNDVDQMLRIDPPQGGFNAGVTFGFNHAALSNELVLARTAINALSSTGTLDTGGDGELNMDMTITLSSGLNVIDIDTDNNDFLLNNMNLVIDGPADAAAIFRLAGNDNMLIANSNILIGMGGIGLSNVLFYTDQAENDTHFSFGNTIINGAAFWSLGPNGGGINIGNAQGCTQLVADTISLNDVRFGAWAPSSRTSFTESSNLSAKLSRKRKS